jgi:hypothetical protein
MSGVTWCHQKLVSLDPSYINEHFSLNVKKKILFTQRLLRRIVENTLSKNVHRITKYYEITGVK